MQRSVSIKDIAKAAGVSPSTVSRALHHHPRISEETATRIRCLAQEMGYSPSLPARSLVTRHTATIGLVITYASDPFLGRLVIGVEEAARAAGCKRFFLTTTNDNLRALRFYQKRGLTIAAIRCNVLEAYRKLKPEIPMVGSEDIPIRDEIELEKMF